MNSLKIVKSINKTRRNCSVYRGGIFKVKNSNSNEGYGTWEGLRVFGIFNPERGGGRREGGGLGT